MDIVHKIRYIIEFKQPVDYFDVILQKQIDLRLKFEGNENRIIVLDLSDCNQSLSKSKYYSKYKSLFNNYNLRISHLELINSSDKYDIIKHIYSNQKENNSLIFKDKKSNSYDEFEYEFDLMLEELNVFCNTFEFDSNQNKIINSIIEDPNLKSNIKFCGWQDYWVTL